MTQLTALYLSILVIIPPFETCWWEKCD